MTLNEFYGEVGGDYADVVCRLQNEALVKRFLKMIASDKSMTILDNAMETNDVKEAFRAVHTLKGIALNLSLTSLAEMCSCMTEAVRDHDVMPDNANELYKIVKKEYDHTINALNETDM